MDLLSIIQSLWRHKFVTIPVLVLTAVLALYVVKLKPPSYQSTASVLLANPQGPATETQIAANPGLKKVNPYNTFTSYGDLDVVADTVIQVITAPSSAQALTNAGVNPNYQITVSTAWGNPPIINITGIGSSPESAFQSARGLVNVTKTDLYNLQKSQGINDFYMITPVVITPPNPGLRSSSGKLRSIIAVLGLGILLLFVAVSVTEAVDKRRRGSSEVASTPIRRYARDRSSVGAAENGHTPRTRVR